MNELRCSSWYASRVIPHLPPEAFKPVPSRLLWGVLHLLLVASSIFAIGWRNLHPLIELSLSLIIATGFIGLGFLGHEILHGAVVRTPWLRDLLGGIALMQFSVGPKLWRKWHNMEHHAHTQEEHTDPDAMGTIDRFFERPALSLFYRPHPWVRSLLTFTSFLVYFSVFSIMMLKKYYRDFRAQDRPKVLMQYAIPTLFWLMLLVWMGPGKWFFAYLLPLMIANFVVICYISTNHHLNPLTEENDPLANSLSVNVPRWMDVLHLNFSHHTEHHLFPGMNPKWAPLVKEQLRRQFPDRYHEMSFGQALMALWRTPRIYKDRVELVDPVRGLQYGSLGHGLNPAKIVSRTIE